MTSLRAAAALLLVLLPIASASTEEGRPPLSVTLVLNGDPSLHGEGFPAKIRATPISTGGQETLPHAVKVPGEARLALPGSAQLSLEAEGYWSPKVLVGENDTSVRMEVWPAGDLAGKVQAPPGVKTPSEISVRFESSTAPGKAPDFSQQTVVCPISEGRWSCRLPAGKLDLRMRARGFISHFRWAAVVPAHGKLDVGTLGLRPGASVVGKVEVSEGAISPQTCRVELSPARAGLATSSEQGQQHSKLSLSAAVDERGFFHLEGVPPGSYVVTANQPGFAPARIFPISVMATAESEIREPLVLRRPLTLHLSLDPPLDPWNRPWQIRLFSRSSVPGSLENQGKTEASGQGKWAKPGLSPGDYSLDVQDSSGSSYAWEDISLDTGSSSLEVTLPLVWVEGKVLLGKEPLAANLSFGGRHGMVRVVLRSDSKGEISGVLPREGDWEVDIDAESPPVHRRLPRVSVRPVGNGRTAKLEIRLPDTEVSGEVVDEKGAPVSRARVFALELQTAYPTVVETDAHGEFQIKGLPEGALSLVADKSDEKSDEVAVDLREGSLLPAVRLVLRKTQEIHGRVAAGGAGVPGARVFALAMNPASAGFVPKGSQALTDVEGRFRLALPSGAAETQFVVLAPGFTASLQRLQGLPKEGFEVQVEPQGGTLTLRPGDEGDPADPQSARLLLLSNGALVDSTLLRMWAEINGVRSQEPGRLVVPQLASGTYTACWAGLPEVMQTLRTGVAPQMASCVTGALSAGGELILERPNSNATP